MGGSRDLAFSSTFNVDLNYSAFDEPGVEAYYHVFEPRDGSPRTNVKDVAHDCTIHDVRGHERGPQLDVHGFQFVDIPPSAEQAWESEASVAAGPYYGEVLALLRQHMTFSRCELFDNTVRRQVGVEAPGNRQPVSQVHVDQSKSAVERRVRLHAADDAERILSTGQRLRIVNIWRPLIEGSPVYDKPLALADYSTVDPSSDFFLKKRIAPERIGETMGVRYSPRHRWYMLGGQKSTEATLIKCYDSDDSKAVLTPHTAFVSPLPRPDGWKPRASVEVRALLIGG